MSRATEFNDYRFKGLNHTVVSNKYYTMDRVSGDKNKIVVKVGDSHLIKTQYGYALIIDATRVVFLKEWQVDRNYFGNEVILDRSYFNVKEWGEHSDFYSCGEVDTFDKWLEVAQCQHDAEDLDGDLICRVKWGR